MRSPVVLLTFNRPDLTALVFDAVRAARPPVLLIVADGPRATHSADIGLCHATRAIFDQVDWPCQVLRNFSDANLGLRARVSSGLNWAFEQVEEAIVLEDDCLPHPSFFRYCDELLESYRHDNRVMAISGDNYQRVRSAAPVLLLLQIHHVLGLGELAARLGEFDLSMTLWPAFRDAGGLRAVCPDPVEHDYWFPIFEAMHAGTVNSWAYAWLFAGFVHSGLSPHPNVNLVSNVGFRTDGTHTQNGDPNANLPTADLGDIVHPPFVFADREADLREFDFSHHGEELRKARTLGHKIRGLPRRILNKGRGLLAGQKP